MVSDVIANTDFAVNTLGFKLREQKIGDAGAIVGSWLSVSACPRTGVDRDSTGSRGRFHHVAFWYGAPQHLLDIADIFSEREIRIESGPPNMERLKPTSFIALSRAAIGLNSSAIQAI